MQLINGIAALLAALPVAEAAQALIQNNCNVPVYLWAVDINRNPQQPSVIAPGASYSEPYHTLSTGGVSLKLAKTSDLSHTKITQFEYTLAGGFIWYDGSNVNCRGTDCPFYVEGIFMETSDPSCPKRTCKANTDCNGFYIEYNDDWNSLSCRPDSDIKFYLCSSSATPGSSTGSGASSPAVASTGSTSGAATPPKASVSIVPVAVPSSASVAAPAASNKITMDAVTPWKGRKNGGFVKKIKARDDEIHARDLHSHMRRHNHGRKH